LHPRSEKNTTKNNKLRRIEIKAGIASAKWNKKVLQRKTISFEKLAIKNRAPHPRITRKERLEKKWTE